MSLIMKIGSTILPTVDPTERLRFWVERGIIDDMPTPKQMAKGEAYLATRTGIMCRIPNYLRHPTRMFPTRLKRARVRVSNEDCVKDGIKDVDLANAERVEADLPPIEQALHWAFLFSPLKFATQMLFNPWQWATASGLTIPERYIIEHIGMTNHPAPLWDIQLIAPEPGALDRLEGQIRRHMSSTTAKSRLYRAMAPRPGYYDHTLQLIDRTRRLDFPEQPGLDPLTYDLTAWLRFVRSC